MSFGSTISRRRALQVLGAIGAVAALAACGSAQGAAARATATTGQAARTSSAVTTASGSAPISAATVAKASAAPTVGGRTELVLWHWDGFLKTPYTQEGALYTKEHPNVAVTVEETPSGQFRQKLIAAIAGGDPPDVTGVTVTRPDFVILASTDQLTHLGPYISRDKFDIADFYPFNLKQHSWKGTQYSLPYSFNTTIWYYNADLLSKESVTSPTDEWRQKQWTWDTYKQLAQQLTRGNGASQQWGTVQLYPTSTAAFFPMVWSNGGTLFNQDYTQCTLGEPAALAAFQFYYDCLRYAPDAQQAKTAKYQAGDVAMWSDWDDRYEVYEGQVNFKYGITATPAAPQTNTAYFVGNAPGFGIPKAVKRAEDSWSLIQFLLSPDSLTRVFLLTDNGPSRKSLGDDKAFWLKNTKLPDPQLMADIAVVRGQHTHNPPKVSNYDDMITAMDDELKPVWAGQRSLEVGVQQVVSRWNDLLKQAQVDPDND